MKTTNEITEEHFEQSVKNLNPPPVESRYSYRSDIPISYAYYDFHEIFNRIEEPEWDPAKDCVAKEKEFRYLSPPPRPQFNQKNRGHTIVPIEEILEEPGRTLRPEK